MELISQFGETKINMISKIYRFQVVIDAKEKYRRVLGGTGIFESWKLWPSSIILNN